MTSRTSTPPEQLALLTEPEVPVQFRLDDATRRRGLRHIAAIRAQLERQSLQDHRRRTASPTVPTHLRPVDAPAPDRARPAA